MAHCKCHKCPIHDTPPDCCALHGTNSRLDVIIGQLDFVNAKLDVILSGLSSINEVLAKLLAIQEAHAATRLNLGTVLPPEPK